MLKYQYPKLTNISKIGFMLFTIALYGCGGSGGSDNNNQAPTPSGLSGIVTAPGGVVAQLQSKSMFASVFDTLFPAANATITGTSPVSGVQVDLIRIDADGSIVGGVIASDTTDSAGAFEIDVDVTQIPPGPLVLRVDSGSAVMRALASAPVVEINPVTEYVLSQLESVVAADPALDFTRFTPEEIQNMVDAVDLISIDVSGTTVADAVAQIAAQAEAILNQQISIASIDLNGDWLYVEITGANNCGDPVGVIWLQSTWRIEQDGNTITIYDGNGVEYGSGELDGLEILNLPMDSFIEQGGVVTINSQSYDVSPDGDSVEATFDWTWTMEGFSCSGTNTASITRMLNG